MTREEAKEILTHNWTRVDNPNYSESELDEAFFMAIEALSPTNLKEEFESADDVHTCNTCADKTLCIMSAPDGNWRACKDYKPAVPNCQKCAIKELWEETEKEDLVSVVRCKDCIHWKADNEVFELGFCCIFPQKWVAETFYCADGERREELAEQTDYKLPGHDEVMEALDNLKVEFVVKGEERVKRIKAED